MNCGMRISDCGFKVSRSLQVTDDPKAMICIVIPQSEIRNLKG